MRCKCGFNSFDHNLVCPKCHKDLTSTRRLLNLDMPMPGGVNFFQIAGQRMATPQPFLEAAEGEREDFGEYLQPLEVVQPLTYDVTQPVSLDKTMSAQPFLGTPAYGGMVEELEEIIPSSPQDSTQIPVAFPPLQAQIFSSQMMRPVAVDQSKEPMIEIEVTDDFEIDQPGNLLRPEPILASVTPLPAHKAAMDQIKSTLTETGDLSLDPEAEPYALGRKELVATALPSNLEAAGGPGDDFSALVSDVNLDKLEGDL